MDLSLKGRTAIVSGSTQGIGFACATELALLGANCVLLARNEISLREAIKKLDISQAQQHKYLVADFSKPSQLKLVIENFMQKNDVQILINNTGGPPAGPIIEAPEDAFVNAFNQHLICNHILTKAVVPSMKETGYGRVINIISTSVKVPLKNLGVSNTIRGAVASWAKTMANELGPYNITVNNILPGSTRTQRLESLIKTIAINSNKSIETVELEMQNEIPLKRFADPLELAAVVAFLASPAASYVNGVSIPVDGGRTGSI
ncbi:MAG TPA: SDR family oxidoreductase [Chitinophagaceae bacterium]